MVNRDRKFTRTVENPERFEFIRYTPPSLGTTFIRKHVFREGDKAKGGSKGTGEDAPYRHIYRGGKEKDQEE